LAPAWGARGKALPLRSQFLYPLPRFEVHRCTSASSLRRTSNN